MGNSQSTHPMTRVALASCIGTSIEFYDFFVFGMAAALVFGPLFFPPAAEGAQTLNAFLSFGIAFFARPVGALLFGHFGDRIGRKATLVGSLSLMGVSTVLIGCLPGYASIGFWAPVLLCLCRFGQGLGLGGEWGGAALLATENAPPGRRAWYGMFPQFGPPFGFAAAAGSFILLGNLLDDAEFRNWGWRIPFLASILLLAIGLYVRLKLIETPVFRQALERHRPERVPLLTVLREHPRPVVLGMMAMTISFALFYMTTVFALSYGVTTLGYPRNDFLGMLCVAVLCQAIATPISTAACDRFGRRVVLLTAMAMAVGAGFLMEPLLGRGNGVEVTLFLCIELTLMGFVFAPMSAVLTELFPTRVRYTGAGVAYNLGGIFGASLSPYFAQMFLKQGGLELVGYYMSICAAISFIGVLGMRETRGSDLARDD